VAAGLADECQFDVHVSRLNWQGADIP
jgi:hypothetical protein